MTQTIFSHSVHPARPLDSDPKPKIYPPDVRVAPTPFRPLPFTAVPLGDQIVAAVNNKIDFGRALRSYPLSIRPDHPKSLCKNAYRADWCLDGIFCRHAGNLAELYAHNIAHNQFYKTRACAVKDCSNGLNCPFGHKGDLMRSIFVSRRTVITKDWYIQK